jgi:putative ABC transport system permease protein
MDFLLQDLRYGLRAFIRQPIFSLTAIVALALGIGANTAVFSVVYAVLLKPLPFPDPDALVYIHDSYPAVASASVSFAKLEALRDANRTLADLGGLAPVGLTLTGGEPEQIPATRATAAFFRALAVPPLFGRWFNDDEDTPGGSLAIVLSYPLWQRRFGGDPRVIGETTAVDGRSRTIVGVMPATFGYPTGTQAWIPLAMSRSTASGGNFMRLLGRMRPGVTVVQVQQDLSSVSEAFNAQNGLKRDVRVWPLHEFFVTNNRRQLLVLQGTVAFVLLVACANVANLLLARSVSRQRELAIRAALGAGRRRLVRQLLTESVMLSVAGGIVGVLLAGWLLRLFLSLAPAGFPRRSAISMDLGVLAFTFAVATLTGLLFGIAPARRCFRSDPTDSLRDTGARGATAGGARGASRALVVAEVALALVLVIGAGLMVKSLQRLQGEATGFQSADLFTFDLNLPQARYANAEPRDFYRRLLDEIRAVPGVRGAAAISVVPLTSFGFKVPFSVQGQPPAADQGQAPVTEYRYVTPGYFAAMGIPVIRGREFTEQNTDTDRPVVLINETMARTHFAGRDPIGARMQLGADPQNVVREVIGVVGDVRDAVLSQPPVPETYMPHAQSPVNGMGLVVRLGSTRADAVLPAIRQRLAAIDPEVAMVRPRMMQAVVDGTTGGTRMQSVLTSVFALVAALLASVGVYSLISYSVAERTREVGIRVALGADRRAVVRLIVGEGLVLAGIGIAAGVAGALLLTPTLGTLLYEVSPTDPMVLATTCTAVLVVTAVASLVPALRAIRVDPMTALRAD